MQLNPLENFTITRQLQDPAITDTFYVRVVIRNAKLDTIIDTLDLTDQGGQRFTKVWKVPADVSGQGFWISTVTSVYTDSGHTTKSTDYGDEERTYLIQAREPFNPNYPLPTGQDIDYKKIKKIIKEVVDEAEKNESEPIVVTKEVVREVKVPTLIPNNVEIPPYPSFAPILKAIAEASKQIKDKPVTVVPPQKEVDLTPIVTKLLALESQVNGALEKINKDIKGITISVKLADFLNTEKNPEGSKPAPKKETTSPIDPRIIKVMKLK